MPRTAFRSVSPAPALDPLSSANRWKKQNAAIIGRSVRWHAAPTNGAGYEENDELTEHEKTLVGVLGALGLAIVIITAVYTSF
jgi:hypothetical protein